MSLYNNMWGGFSLWGKLPACGGLLGRLGRAGSVCEGRP
jgi:hypothetical protein